MSSYTANNKLIYTWTRGSKPVPASLLTSYAESLIIDGEKRTLWHKGHQIGNSYYGSQWGESFNDFASNTASGSYSHAEGTYTAAKGTASHAENAYTVAYGDASHAEGMLSYAIGDASHAEGLMTVSYGSYSHVEGSNVLSYGSYSHSEGQDTVAYGDASHAEGNRSSSYGSYSHSEGQDTVAYGDASHASGHLSYAIGDYSSASGEGTQAYNSAETALGHWNISYDGTDGIHEKTIFTIGNGVSYDSRSNVITVTDNATYMSEAAYFGDHIFGSSSYSYIDYFKNVTMEQLMHALLDGEEKYTQPILYTKLSYYLINTDILIPAKLDNIIASYDGSINVRTTMEIGTELQADINLYWPISSTGGTRSSYLEPDYDTINPVFLGYSYGLSNDAYVSVNSNNVQPEYPYVHHELNKVAYFNSIDVDSKCTYETFLNEATQDDQPFNIIGYMYVPVRETSYMLYSRLWKQGAKQISYDGWIDKQTIAMPFTWSVNSRYRWFAGISYRLPQTPEEIRTYDSGFLDYPDNNTDSVVVHKVTLDESHSLGYFWVAVPILYDHVDMYDDHINIAVKRGDGVIWDLVTPQQPLYGDIEVSYMPIGENAANGKRDVTRHKASQTYNIYYVKLTCGNLGNDVADEIYVKFRGKDPGEIDGAILTEDRDAMLVEPESLHPIGRDYPENNI